jgi:hypothetical protein
MSTSHGEFFGGSEIQVIGCADRFLVLMQIDKVFEGSRILLE